MPGEPADRAHRPVAGTAAAFWLGFALGGFFDGIVLHQVLQWHHLLSAVEAPGLVDLRAQVLADGLFHVAMYGIAALALWRLARGGAMSSRALAARVLVGFGTWHAVDAVLSHWVLGIHRIRMDTDVPLAWDLGWLLVFGLLPAALGVALARRGGPPRAGAGPATLAGWAGLTAVAALAASAAPPPTADGDRFATVVLASAAHAPRVLADLADGVAIVGAAAGGTVWRLRVPADAHAPARWRDGVLWVAGAGAGGGCAAWTRPATGRPAVAAGPLAAAPVR